MLYELERIDGYQIQGDDKFLVRWSRDDFISRLTLAHDYEDAIKKFTVGIKRDAVWDTVVNYDINHDRIVTEERPDGKDYYYLTRYKIVLQPSIDLLDSDLEELKKRALKGTMGIEDQRWIADIIDYILEARSTEMITRMKLIL